MDINDAIEGLRYLTKENLESGVLQKIKKFSSSTRVIKEEYGDNDKEKGRAKSLSKSLSPPNGAKLLDELTPEDLKGRPRLLEIYVYHEGKWHHVPVEGMHGPCHCLQLLDFFGSMVLMIFMSQHM